jgi:hypothetical protein
MTFKKSLLFRIAFQSSKDTWRPQYNTKQGFVNYKMVQNKGDHVCENTDNEYVGNAKGKLLLPYINILYSPLQAR